MRKSTRYTLVALLVAVLMIAVLVGCNYVVNVTVTVDGQSYETLEVQKGTLLSAIEKPVIEGKLFVRWEINGEAVNENEFIIQEDCTVNAVFEVQMLKVTFVNGDDVSYETVEYGKTVAEKALAEREWCTFEGWFNGEAKYDFSQPVKSDLTLTAVWKEDLEGAKAALTEEFNALYIPAAYYGEYVQQAEKAFNDGISAINAAQNVDAVMIAFNEASEKLTGIRTYFDLIEETVAQYGEENYFAAQWAEIEAIFEDACNYIRSYEGGVPTVEDYIAMAIAKADEVNTKEEDTEIAEGQKLVKIRQLENYAADVIRNLEDEELIARVNQYLEEGIAAINAATGTTELAEIFAEYMAKIGAIVG